MLVTGLIYKGFGFLRGEQKFSGGRLKPACEGRIFNHPSARLPLQSSLPEPCRDLRRPITGVFGKPSGNAPDGVLHPVQCLDEKAARAGEVQPQIAGRVEQRAIVQADTGVLKETCRILHR